MNRLSHVLEIEESDQRLDSLTNELMRLFHAQRNYYITGFALVLLLLINRIVDLIWKNALFKMTYNEALKQVEMKNNKMNELLNGANVNSEVRSLALKCIEIEEKIRKTEIEYEDMEDQVDNLKVEYEKVCHLLKTAKNV
uniref:Endoplasmic reticulum transmembrane protein n=1 Tax=Acrobeloides nanus TaxID=290746 RepID=A0A914CD39_9BILA